ncbi:MAG: DUF2341 domain-containing protein [Bacteroidota bacterium]|nr:DUF2341 domain-containing protein [Bacteroidota bacterium]
MKQIITLFATWMFFNAYAFSQCVNPNIYTTTFNVVNTGPALTNKTVKVLVNTQQLIGQGQMQSNGSDIRFGASCCTLYSYWIDSLTFNTSSTAIWVRIPTLAASSTFSLKMFHGSSTLTSLSNFNTTFPLRYILTSGSDSLLGTQTFDWFEVRSPAILYIRTGQLLNINAEYIFISGTINGIGRGQAGSKTGACSAGQGLGGGLAGASCANGGGAGYGGLGGCAPVGGASSCMYSGGAVYGTTAGTDIDMGSGGSTGSSSTGNGAGNGGGGIRLSASGITISGTINVSGQDGQGSSTSSSGGGGGSGGGILINGANIKLTGASLIAAGGRAGNQYGGAGAGGRIKIFRKSPLIGSFTSNVSGSSLNSYGGSVLLSSAIGATGTLYQDSINTGLIIPAFVATVSQPCGLLYYSKSTGVLNDTLSWSTNINGTGTNPPNFAANGASYYVVNNSTPAINANWIVSGTNSFVMFGDGVNSGNFIIPTGLFFGADTFYVNNDFTLTIQGQIYTNKPGFHSNSTTQYTLTSQQNLLTANFGNLIISGATKNLTGNTSVAGVLAMFNNINCNGFTLTLGISALQPGTLNRASGIIIGNLIRWFPATTNTGTTGLFPIGTSQIYRPFQVNFTSSPSIAGTLSSEFINSAPGNAGYPYYDFTTSPIVQLTKSAPEGFWRLVANNGLSGGIYTCTATGTGFSGISTVSDLRLVRRNNPSSSWTVQGTSVLGSGSVSSPVVSRTGVTSAGGDFAIASDSTINALPVKIVSFSAGRIATDVHLKFTTASEFNTDRFEVEKLLHNNWILTNRIKANGNSQQIKQYSTVDKNAFSETQTIYYRLKIIDRDGTSEYSSAIGVGISANEELTISPNPLLTNLNIHFGNTEKQTARIEVYDIIGNLLIVSPELIIEPYMIFEYSAMSQLNPGIYSISIFSNNQWVHKKIIKL